MQSLARDILQTSLLIGNEGYWSKEFSKLYYFATAYAPEISQLVKTGVLAKMIVGPRDLLSRNLPKEIFKNSRGTSKAAHLYRIKDRKQLRQIGTNKEAALKVLGFYSPGLAPSIKNFYEAMNLVRKEIVTNPDPGAFFLKVMDDLLPRRRLSKK